MFSSLVCFAYDQAKLDYEMELLQGEAFKPVSEKTSQKNKPTQKQRIRVSNNKSDSKIVNLESKYFENNKSKTKKKSSFDEIKMMNAAPLRSENTKKRRR